MLCLRHAILPSRRLLHQLLPSNLRILSNCLNLPSISARLSLLFLGHVSAKNPACLFSYRKSLLPPSALTLTARNLFEHIALLLGNRYRNLLCPDRPSLCNFHFIW